MRGVATADPTASSLKSTAYSYDALGRLDIQTDRDESNNVLASFDYTVRADGKRTALVETIWFDANEDGVVDPGEQKTTTYDWTYDNVGRLADEVIDHWDDQFDQTEKFIYDLTGNRRELTRDKGNNSITDAVITYDYDANDRLLEEALDDLTAANDDATTTYAYDHTQQTSKTATSTATLATRSSQLFAYNLQGRMSSVVNEGYTDGTLSSRERTSYDYDSRSYRVSLVNETDSNLDSTFTETSRTEFLADHRNHTGYTQTIRETTTNADGTTKTIDYTFGLDEISQRVVERNPSGDVVSDNTHVFGHDGHGSVRVLYDLTTTLASVAQAFTFAAYVFPAELWS